MPTFLREYAKVNRGRQETNAHCLTRLGEPFAFTWLCSEARCPKGGSDPQGVRLLDFSISKVNEWVTARTH